MTSFVLATVDAGGNVPPMVGIARELVRRGHTVTLLAHSQQVLSLRKTGAEVIAYPTGRSYVASQERSDFADLRDLSGLFADRGIARDVVSTATMKEADVVLVDALLPRTIREVRQAGFATATLVHTFWSYWKSIGRGPFGIAVALRGTRMVHEVSQSDAILVATLASLDLSSDADGAQSRIHHVGAVWQDHSATPDHVVRRLTDQKTILVSLSTTAYNGQGELLQRIVAVLGELPYRVIVTTGPAINPASLTAPEDISVQTWGDHGELLPQVDLLVTHGGHSTATRALHHGVPMVIIPLHDALDQPSIAKRLSELGAAEHVHRTARPDQLRHAVETVIGDPSYRAAAQRLQNDARRMDGATVAADLLERLAARSL